MTFDEPLKSSPPKEQLLSEDALQEALSQDLSAQKIMQKNLFPEKGEIIGVRLNLNVLKCTGVAVQTLHSGSENTNYQHNKGLFKGLAKGYAQAVVLKDAYFNVNQTGREKIATNQSHKHPMASVDGVFESIDIPHDFEGVEIKFNPKAHHLFVDSNNHAIRSAEEVIIIGHRAYARGRIEYHTLETAPKKRGSAPSQTLLKPLPEYQHTLQNRLTASGPTLKKPSLL